MKRKKAETAETVVEKTVAVVVIDVSAWTAVNGEVMNANNFWIFNTTSAPIKYTDQVPGETYFVFPGKYSDAEKRAAAWAVERGFSALYLVNNSISEARVYGIAKAVLGECKASEYIQVGLSFLMDEKNQTMSAILKDASQKIQ